MVFWRIKLRCDPVSHKAVNGPYLIPLHLMTIFAVGNIVIFRLVEVNDNVDTEVYVCCDCY